MRAIVRSAGLPPTLARRISAASPSEAADGKAKDKQKGASKGGTKARAPRVMPAGEDVGSKPSLEPPLSRDDD
jgi:hypothetical protein